MKLKNLITQFILCISVLLLLGSCDSPFTNNIKGSGTIVGKNLNITGFSQIKASQGIKVDIWQTEIIPAEVSGKIVAPPVNDGGNDPEVIQDDNYTVKITYNDNFEDYFIVERSGNRLVLRLKSGYNYSNVKVKAEIHMPELNELHLSSSAHARLHDFEGQNMNINISSAAELNGKLSLSGDLNLDASSAAEYSGELSLAGDLTVNASSAAKADLSGSSENMDLDLSSSAVFSGSDFIVNGILDADLSSGSEANVYGGNRSSINANASSGSKLYHYGNFTTGSVNTSSGGVIESKS